jgi:hypothetical protein
MRCQAMVVRRLDDTKSVTESEKVDDAIIEFPSHMSSPPKNAGDVLMLCSTMLRYAMLTIFNPIYAF